MKYGSITINMTDRSYLFAKLIHLAGLGNTGNQFIVDLERGKPTVQLQKTLDVLDLLGLAVVVRPKYQTAGQSVAFSRQ